jgi:UDP:flavonoid glycosyltransferase YjiC (YdhE family)
MPATPTRAFPNPNLPFNFSAGPLYNRLSHRAIGSISWRAQRSIINRLRREVLDLPDLPRTTPEHRKQTQRIPLLYGFSPSVVPKPNDWPEWNHVTGYWFLDTREDWTPPADLVQFLDAGPLPVYFELGSLTVLVQDAIINVLRGLMDTGCRVVVDPRGTDLRSLSLSDDIYVVTESVPHSWILPRVGAAITHGGPSTVASVLRAGIPLHILPIFRGQYFWGHRTAQLGVGLPPTRARRVKPDQIGRSANILLTNQTMREKASKLGQSIRSEDGVATAVEVFTHYFPPSPSVA